ncbi:ceramide synthase 5 isoform X3 [Trematomus bernacchii]|uniref:ceramide synthase 5 isoform X3 n=1 Tax=Trematomus bernacchii TaxID=40690 RepID=UPI00146F3DD7|nr:ceramide synthase 5 isoform X3 [Trematomus bernacchii]
MRCWRKCLHPSQSLQTLGIWTACRSSWTGRCERSSAGLETAGTKTNPALTLSSVRACGGLHFICAYLPMGSGFCGRLLGCGILGIAGTVIPIRSHSQTGSLVMTPGLYYYYVTELAFYWSLMFSQFTDIKRKDFMIMFIHHLATIGLISFSYVNNMTRVGSLVMCVHDASDFLLELAKLANYAKYQRLCDFLFIVFSVAFFITRLVIYPIWVLNSTMFESWAIVGPYPSWWLFNFLLLVLQVLHIIWSYLIARIAVKAVLRGKVCNDVRSDIESSSENEPDTPTDGPKAYSHSPKGENGTNGHCAAAKARVQNHSSW